MTAESTTIRVTTGQRERLRSLAQKRSATMSATLDDALEALRRIDFYTQMADAERALREDPDGWAAHIAERDEWLNPDLTGR